MSRLGSAMEVLLLVVAIGLALGGPMVGQPLGVTYVETGSMEPTLSPGDGFVLVPAAVAGPVEAGDVVTFRARRLHGGGLTTHRIVDETDRGYMTKGDANPFPDQDGVEPPVKETQIVGTALTVDGRVLVIPHVGTVVDSVGGGLDGVRETVASVAGRGLGIGERTLAYVLVAFGLSTYVGSYLTGRNGRTDPSAGPTDDSSGFSRRQLVLALSLLVVGPVTASMVVPSGPTEVGIVSSETASQSDRVIKRGTSETTTYPLDNPGRVPTFVVVRSTSERLTLSRSRVTVPSQSERRLSVTLEAPRETGYYRQYVVEHHYLQLLPRPVLVALYGIHPWLPIACIDALVVAAYFGLATVLLGPGWWRGGNHVPTVERTPPDSPSGWSFPSSLDDGPTIPDDE